MAGGRWLLAAPILSPGGRRIVHLPEGIWYDFHSGQRLTGPRDFAIQGALNTIPLYVRAGSILPLGPALQSTSLGQEDPLEVRVYPGVDASFTLYEDDGSTYEYQKGAGSGSSRIVFQWEDRRRVLSIGSRTGSFPGMLTTRHFRAVLPGGVRREVVYDGSAVTVE
ncbi:MAG: DUF5110 domain-containing protein [Chloroflexi bacterium]|nr:DUF5110 domain-containing protein [Chloroflexota bacterium]